MTTTDMLRNFPHRRRLEREEALALIACDLAPLMNAAAARRDAAHGNVISYSRKVFIPLTQLCRDVCHYCTFAHPPRPGQRAFMSIDDVLEIARAGEAAGCQEALFTLGDKPELRYRIAREELEQLGHATTLSYLAEAARVVAEKTSLLVHVNPGLMTADDIADLRRVCVSQGIMLESASARLCESGGPHYGSPDKQPEARLETLRLAGERHVPFTSGILIGIGETRAERIDALLAIRDLNDRHGHIQEIIVQNFRPKPGTKMAAATAADLADHLWTIAIARLMFEPAMSIQAPPNLNDGHLADLIAAGINDWGGVSPVTPDHVNPEAPWPHLDRLDAETRACGKHLTQRLAIYPSFAREAETWVDAKLHTSLLRAMDTDGFARGDRWSPGTALPLSANETKFLKQPRSASASGHIVKILARAQAGQRLQEDDIVSLFRARGDDFAAICRAADDIRKSVNGDTVSYIVNRNINYTNICGFKCRFCAFSKGKMSENLRGKPYNLPLPEIADRTREAWARGATEVCMQGGIHPDYTGEHYLSVCRTVKDAIPAVHVHAFSPLEIQQGAHTLGLTIRAFLAELKEAGLGTLPGTAAEILDDEVRAIICPDKIDTAAWLEVMRTAHGLGIRSTATIMFGHVDRYVHWARHLLRIRDLQAETGGFTEFVPLPFVHMEAPIYLKGRSRQGPTTREAILMHAIARLALHPLVPNIQASWVKMGADGLHHCLNSGANDVGGTLMDETISRAAGASHGEEMPPAEMEALIRAQGRTPLRRNTLYRPAARDLPALVPASDVEMKVSHDAVRIVHSPGSILLS